MKLEQSEKELKNNIIAKQHNELNDLPLRGFDAIEADVFFTICEKIQDHGTEEIKIPIGEIHELTALGRKDLKKREFLEKIKSVGKKINIITETEEPGKQWVMRVLFPTFGYLEDENAIIVAVHPYYAPWLNKLSQNYTKIDILQITHLKTFYAKCLYRRLCQYNDTGYWREDKESLKEYLCMPEKSKTSDIKRAIENSIKDLRKFFPNLKYECVYDSSNTKGRPALVAFIFIFTPKKRKSFDKLSQEQIAEMTGARWTGKYCPNCGEKIFEKEFENNGEVYLKLGHTNYKTGGCDFRPSYDGLLTKEQADAKFGGEEREAAKGPSVEVKAKQEARENEIFDAEDREREAALAELEERAIQELTERLGRTPTEEELDEDARNRALAAVKNLKF